MSEYNEDSTCEHGNDALSLVCGLCIEEHEQVVAKEVAELRAYKERTEAALWEFCEVWPDTVETDGEGVVCELRRLGLWRDKEQGK